MVFRSAYQREVYCVGRGAHGGPRSVQMGLQRVPCGKVDFEPHFRVAAHAGAGEIRGPDNRDRVRGVFELEKLRVERGVGVGVRNAAGVRVATRIELLQIEGVEQAVRSGYAVRNAVDRLEFASGIQEGFEVTRDEADAIPTGIGDGDTKSLEAGSAQERIEPPEEIGANAGRLGQKSYRSDGGRHGTRQDSTHCRRG